MYAPLETVIEEQMAIFSWKKKDPGLVTIWLR